MLNLGDCDKIHSLYARPLSGGRVEITIRSMDEFGVMKTLSRILPGGLEKIMDFAKGTSEQTPRPYKTQIPPYTGNWE